MIEQGQKDAIEDNSSVAGLKDGERECGQPLEAEKGKEKSSLLNLKKGMQHY